MTLLSSQAVTEGKCGHSCRTAKLHYEGGGRANWRGSVQWIWALECSPLSHQCWTQSSHVWLESFSVLLLLFYSDSERLWDRESRKACYKTEFEKPKRPKKKKNRLHWRGWGIHSPFKLTSGKLHFPFHRTSLFLSLAVIQACLNPAERLDIHGLLLHLLSWKQGFSQSCGMFINASHLKHPAQAIAHRCLPWIIFEKATPVRPHVQHTHTYFSLLTGLTVGPVRLIVQLLGDHAQEFSLVFISIVVWGPYADQLGRHRSRSESSFRAIQ